MSSDQIQEHIKDLKAPKFLQEHQYEQALALWEIAKQLARMNEGQGHDTAT